MKGVWKGLIFLVVVAALLGATPVRAQGPGGDKYVFGDTYTLGKNETLEGNLFIFGGNVILEEGSTVHGNVMVAGGRLNAGGTITGDVLSAGGLIDLGNSAVIQGDLTKLGTTVHLSNGARVVGKTNEINNSPLDLFAPGGGQLPQISLKANPLLDGLWLLFRSFLWAALALLVVMFLPKQTEQAARTAVSQPVISAGLGLLTVIFAAFLLIGLVVIIIGIPLSLLGAFALAVTWAFGLIVIGTEVGRRGAELFKQEWALPVAAGLGTFVLVLISDLVARSIPCIGWGFGAVLGLTGMGAVLLTRYGTQPYPPADPSFPGAGLPPVPAVPPSTGSQPPARM